MKSERMNDCFATARRDAEVGGSVSVKEGWSLFQDVREESFLFKARERDGWRYDHSPDMVLIEVGVNVEVPEHSQFISMSVTILVAYEEQIKTYVD